MDAVAATLEGLALAQWLRYSRWGYAALNATHLLGISLLVGTVVTLDLRLLGCWQTIALGPLYRVLSRVAASGLVVAIASGALLFCVRATEYAALDLLLVKLMLISAGATLAGVLHYGFDIVRMTAARQRLAGALSLMIWLAVLICGRLLAFV